MNLFGWKLSDIKPDAVSSGLKNWLVKLFINAINRISKDEDRLEVIQWLTLSREVVGCNKSTKDKFVELYSLMDSRKTVQIVCNGVVEAVKNYKNADLPLAMKVAVPVTLLAVPVIGGQGAGVAALGGAIGLPVLLLVFLGTAGLTSIIEGFVGSADARSYLSIVAELIARDEFLRCVKAAMKNGTQGEPREPVRAQMPEDEVAIRDSLFVMDPFDFENHVMSFFRAAGLEAAATQKSNDGGFDGFARHPDGLILVQCKRYAADNKVGVEAILQFKGVLEENEAFRGYFVTTSQYTANALKSAEKSAKLVLIEMNELIRWHKASPTF
jgi:hypothetical protein